jgi:dihydrolipoamide dehydrogenase
MPTIDVKVPDIGGSAGIPVIELLVKPGDTVGKDQGLVTLESDKATMEVPSPAAGVITALRVKLGDEVSEGDVIATLEVAEAAASDGKAADHRCQLVVIGAGPGGYTAAFRAADLGLDVVLIERYPTLGGVCLNVGCIPSKALLHTAAILQEAKHMDAVGVSFGAPSIDVDRLRGHKQKVIGTLTKGLAGMAKQRKVRVLQGTATFASPNELDIASAEGRQRLAFEQAIIAAGSQPVKLPGFPWGDPRVMDSTDALELPDIPKKLLVVGGGIIGLEMACVYAGLGSAVTVVELGPQLMPGTDLDLVKPLADLLKSRGVVVHLDTRVSEVLAKPDGLHARFEGGGLEGGKAPAGAVFDRVLVSVGRSPNGGKLAAEKAGVQVSERGFIPVDRQMRTNVRHIFAIGDLVGQPMLAHKATHEGKLAAEVAAGQGKAGKGPEWVARVIPSVAYTDPEVAWVGVTETEAKAKGLAIEVGRFPWAASGRAIGNGRTEGFTKLILDADTHRVLGGGIVGTNAGDLIGEVALAIEMGAEAGDIGHTIHPHPTLIETVAMAAEVAEGTITDLYLPKRPKPGGS